MKHNIDFNKAYETAKKDYENLFKAKSLLDEFIRPYRTPKYLFRHCVLKGGFKLILMEYRLAKSKLNHTDLAKYKELLEKLWGTTILKAVKEEHLLFPADIDDLDDMEEMMGEHEIDKITD